MPACGAPSARRTRPPSRRSWAQEWDHPAALRIGEEVTAAVEVIEARADKPITHLACVARLADGTEVVRGGSVVYTVLPDEDSR